MFLEQFWDIPQAFIQRLIGSMQSCRCCKRWLHKLLNSANNHTAWQFLIVLSVFLRYTDSDYSYGILMCFWLRKSWQTRATWHLALSCWKTWSKFRCCRKGRMIGSRISSLYFTGGFTPSNTSFIVMNPDFHFVLAMDVIMCTAVVWNV
jgi:hypothetical protein